MTSIDITGEVCPMTYVRVKLALEPLPSGALVEVWLKGDEPLRNVPRSLRDEGHTVLELVTEADGRTRLLFQRA
ncbi:MAG: sulfurtransferase TusA family protein [Archangium sp.]|nr:sulfurtransferase TusA family protein [Archangium sp.]